MRNAQQINIPTRATSHLNAHAMAHIHHTIFHTENAILHGIFHFMNETRLLMLITRVLTESLTHVTPSAVIGVSPNDSFLQTKYFFKKKLKTHWKILQCSFDFIKSRVLCNFGPRIFGFTQQDAAHLFNIFMVFHRR